VLIFSTLVLLSFFQKLAKTSLLKIMPVI